jgi:hypothetical protein
MFGIPIIGEIIGNVIGIGRDWLKGRREIKQAEVTTRLAIEGARARSAIKLIELDQTHEHKWDETMAEGSILSWKDEYLTILCSIPIIMCFIPFLAPYALEGFRILETTPEWFRYTFGVIVAASFGIRKAADIIGAVRK